MVTDSTVRARGDTDDSQDVCSCDTCSQNITVLVGAYPKVFDYFQARANEYMRSKPHVHITLLNETGDGRIAYQERLLEEARQGVSHWDAVFLPALLTGDMVELDALWDLTDFVRHSKELDWPDVLSFFREELAVYDHKVRLIPLDGDSFLMYYRKDLFDEFNITVPRTWQEYNDAAQFFHGLKVGPNETAISGSCVSRVQGCGNAFWANLILSTMTQSQGTSSGFLFDPETMEPLLGPAFEETLTILAEQFRFGAETELTSVCLDDNFRLNQGACALTYNWGNQMDTIATSDYEIGVAPTPGSRMVLDRSTKWLVNCTRTLCPHAIEYEDIGLVNVAPYAAFGGWAASVSNFSPLQRQVAAAEFLAHLSSPEQSLRDVIPDMNGTRYDAFAQPYRRSHLRSKDWVEIGGFTHQVAKQILTATLLVGASQNTVVEMRIPRSGQMQLSFDAVIVELFTGIQNGTMDVVNVRSKLTRRVERELRKVVNVYDSEHAAPLQATYQRSLGVFLRPADSNNLMSDALRYVGYAASITLCLLALGFAIWTAKERKHHVVQASQPFLLYQICAGIFLLGGTIILLTLDDSVASDSALDRTCMAIPWITVSGFSVFFAALASKIATYWKVFKSKEEDLDIRVKYRDAWLVFVVYFGVNGILLLIWTLVDPLTWKRLVDDEGSSSYDFQLPNTYGICTGDNKGYIAFLSVIAVYNIVSCFVAVVFCYRTRTMTVEFKESKWVACALLPFIEVWCVGIPLLYFVRENPPALFLLLSILIWVSSTIAILFLFVPKVKSLRKINRRQQRSSRRVTNPSALPSSTYERRASGIQILKHPQRDNELELERLRENLDSLEARNAELEAEIEELESNSLSKDGAGPEGAAEGSDEESPESQAMAETTNGDDVVSQESK